MVNSALQSTTSFLASDRWIQAGWNDYLQAIEQSAPKVNHGQVSAWLLRQWQQP